MFEPNVIGDDTQTPSVPATGQGKDEKDVTMSRADFDSLNRQLTESRDSERYWSTAARSGRPAAVAEPEVEDNAAEFIDDEDLAIEEIAGDTTEAMIDEFAKKGVGALTRRGLITRADAVKIATEAAVKVSRELIGREVQKRDTDSRITKDFPELQDKKSELWIETARRYQEVVEIDPGALKSPAALYLAAKSAKEHLARTRSVEDDDSPEAERRHRSDSQDGRTRTRTRVAADDMIGPEAAAVIKGFGITADEFNGQRTKGRR